MFRPVIFREYDIRGVFGEDFDLDFARLLGRSFATYLRQVAGHTGPLRVNVGYDARLSSPDIFRSLREGLVESGAEVVGLGLVTTPVCYFSMFNDPQSAGGIMITGSHNPPEYNGFKISVGQTTIYGDSIQKLREIAESEAFVTGPRGSFSEYDIFPNYVARYQQEFGRMKPVKVVLDCGNGAAGSIARRLYSAVGLEPVILFEKPDGTFPNHHPDPTVEENLVDLKARVRETGAVVGIGFDGDADRIGMVDQNGTMILGDEMMVIIARDILSRTPGAKIIGDVKCSDRLYNDIKMRGGQPIMWKTGHSLIKNKIKVEKAPFGGELSGHIFFADRNYGFDDALYAGLRIIEILGRTGKTLTQLLDGLPSAHNTPEIRIDTTEDKKLSIVAALKSRYASDGPGYQVNHTDGVRISFKDGWALVRSSNTQPVLVMRFESETKDGLNRIRDQIESLVRPML
jgi:phosphomannomutase/phosphomannomutase/phosphoglucomutase